ncbi:DUF5606 domain-containing protein [Algibacter sp. L4_22]|uniref:DUF5606 family protein n=1 Tax=Algibacter sp. L4_22 TaxID=2942477 RepID=UPI00201B55F1|nr:DUF5606 domain-containing protein [Algibacter sp. L4_22]MCL5129762.1 DUF5606 domain-containing protein [Algibacter sp. L4_22]
MSLDKVLSIAGKPGLYNLVTQTRGGFIAESLIDKKRITVNVRQNVSVLSEIAIYTLTEEVPLKQVLLNIKNKENGQESSVKPKDGKDKLEEYFFDVLPDYDEDRVYPSDIKKVLQWYNLLVKNNFLDDLEAEVAESKAADEEE